MKREFIIVIIVCVFVLVLSGCDNETHKEVLNNDTLKNETIQPIELKDNISELFEKDNLENIELEIKQSNGNYYKAAPEFKEWLFNTLKRHIYYTPGVELDNKSYDFVLKFKGYKELYLNSSEGVFWIADKDIIFEIRNWPKRFWDRHLLKEIDGEIFYYGFERDIIKQTLMDVDKDDKQDDVMLFYDGDIKLKVKDTEVIVMEDVEEGMISSLRPSNNLESNLYIKEMEEDDSFVFLVGATYTFTNKYGSTSWLMSFKYKNGVLSKDLNSNDILESKVIVKEYKNNILTLYISGLEKEIDVKLTQEEVDRISRYLEFLKEGNESFLGKEDYLFLAIMPQYKFYDYDNDGKEDLIARIYMRGGAPGITDQLIAIYDFSREGLKLKELLSGRDNKELTDMLY